MRYLRKGAELPPALIRAVSFVHQYSGSGMLITVLFGFDIKNHCTHDADNNIRQPGGQ